MKWILIISASFSFLTGHAQVGSEIILFDLQVKAHKVSVSNPKNITNHKGYDNQPYFHPDQPLIYYTSFNDSGRAEIKSYNFKKAETKLLTQTHEREYSPTLTPDGHYISCIIQRDNGAQDLGKYPTEGGAPLIIINNLTVGYHAWADNSHLALFVLGQAGSSNTLHFVRLPTRHDTVLAKNIGRSLHRVPHKAEISFVQKTSDTNWQIKKFNTLTKSISDVANTLPGREDLCWTPDEKILMSDGTKLFWLDPAKGNTWTEVEIKSGIELLKGITRLSVNLAGDKLAVVVIE
ncbi:MAG: PD40 domain-containing protein [Bacteroidetes bacterium]|nr:PD40 domain-containing protein [Bacteroidota bacterium]MBS1539028.1 PD40 domain-containing protein [Bacteroidota bacterium]